jgi:hypothetical protein
VNAIAVGGFVWCYYGLREVAIRVVEALGGDDHDRPEIGT